MEETKRNFWGKLKEIILSIIALVIIIIFAAICNPNYESNQYKLCQEKFKATNYQPGLSFFIIEPIKKIEGTELGVVKITSPNINDLSAIIIPYSRNLKTGDTVEILKISYQYSDQIQQDFFMVK